jgi:hypothetical protein
MQTNGYGRADMVQEGGVEAEEDMGKCLEWAVGVVEKAIRDAHTEQGISRQT